METPVILALETSGAVGGITYFKGFPLLSVTVPSKESFCKNLFKIFKFFEKFEDFTLKDVDFFAVDVGPGSFTGLRIGVSVIKALGLVIPKPVVCVTSLEVLAYQNRTASKVAVIRNAYSGEVFFGLYRFEDSLPVAELSPLLVKATEVDGLIPRDAVVIKEETGLSPEAVARLAFAYINRGFKDRIKSVDEVLPFYLKASEAERKTGIKVS